MLKSPQAGADPALLGMLTPQASADPALLGILTPQASADPALLGLSLAQANLSQRFAIICAVFIQQGGGH